MFKNLPEAEFIVNKTSSNIVSTIEFNTAFLIKSLEYYNKLTDNMFFAWTNQTAETLNTATDYAKENITQSQDKIVKLFGSRG